MLTYSDCFPCFFRSTQEAVDYLQLDDVTKVKVYKAVSKQIARFSLSATPPEMGYYIHREIKKQTGNPDPYYEVKKHYNDMALSLYDKIKLDIENNARPLNEAVKFAIAGNLIDFGVTSDFNFPKLLEEIHSVKLDAEAFRRFEQRIQTSENILYLGDNCGEIVFDKILIELLQTRYRKKITYAVRGKSIINDVTMDDAEYTGMDKICHVISNGSGYPGTVLSKTSKQFRKVFKEADCIIAKGQGNYESLSDIKAPLIFLLMAKCKIVARDLNTEQGSFVIKTV